MSVGSVRSGAFVAGVAALLAAACTGGDATPETTLARIVSSTVPSTADTSPIEVPDLTASYFGAIADGRSAAETVAVPGGDADLYARFMSDATRLIGAAAGAVSVTSTPTGLDVCHTDCTTYALVSVEPTSGRVETFTIDGVPLAGRIVGDGLRADDDGVIARVTTAFRNQAGDVLVVVEVRNAIEVAVELFGFAAIYQPAGEADSRESSGWWGPTTVEPATVERMLLAFAAGAEATRALGSGRVSVSGLRADGVEVSLDMTLPRAGG